MDPPQPRRHNNQPQLQAGSVFSRNRRLRPPTPPRGTPLDDCVEWLGDSWMVLFLFETPTGFALFNYPGVKLFLPNAIEEIWADFGKETSLLRDLVILKDFQTFDRTSRAIDIHTGVCSKLADMIKNCLKPKQTLAVGNSDYKKVIEAKMRIYCLCNDAVMEVMWGLNNVLTTILPNEISSVTTGNYPKICQGMQMVLDCYGIHLEPELVNKRITEMVWSIHQFDSAVNKYHHILHLWGQTILEVSQIDTRQWDFLKLATTLMLLSYPKQVKNLSLGDSPEMLTQDEAKKFIEDAPEYHGKLNKDTCRIMYKDIAKARSLRARALRLLGALINEARKVNTKLDCSEV